MINKYVFQNSSHLYSSMKGIPIKHPDNMTRFEPLQPSVSQVCMHVLYSKTSPGCLT